MTENVVNLNKARKAFAKIEKRSKADTNAIKFGRTKSEKSNDSRNANKEVVFLDGHKKET